MDKYDTPFSITEGDDYGKYEYKQPLTIKQLIEKIAEKMDASRYFGELFGWEDLYGIRSDDGFMYHWFTVRRGSFERINWLGQEKCADFLGMAIIEELIREERI